MGRLYGVEVEPEVRAWLTGLNDRDFGRVDFFVGLLAERAEDLGEPYARHLGGKVRNCDSTCWPSRPASPTGSRPGRSSSCSPCSARPAARKTAEVARALQAQKICEAEHGPAHDTFDREVT
jgi:hypothetical protein